MCGVVLVLIAGCYQPSYENCVITCGSLAQCPNGFTCDNGAGLSNNNIDVPYLGLLDEVRLYGRALTSAEIATLAKPPGP